MLRKTALHCCFIVDSLIGGSSSVDNREIIYNLGSSAMSYARYRGVARMVFTGLQLTTVHEPAVVKLDRK